MIELFEYKSKSNFLEEFSDIELYIKKIFPTSGRFNLGRSYYNHFYGKYKSIL